MPQRPNASGNARAWAQHIQTENLALPLAVTGFGFLSVQAVRADIGCGRTKAGNQSRLR